MLYIHRTKTRRSNCNHWQMQVWRCKSQNNLAPKTNMGAVNKDYRCDGCYEKKATPKESDVGCGALTFSADIPANQM